VKLTNKDKEFLERLQALLQEKEMSVDLKEDVIKKMVLIHNYGVKVESAFGVTRQGVRWRFQRLFNEIYVSAYETIYLIETRFGTELRNMAIEIAKERVEMRRKCQKMDEIPACRR